ncbi:MAG: hypothetical protein ACHQDB_07025 [Steroidobacterales bacterium]
MRAIKFLAASALMTTGLACFPGVSWAQGGPPLVTDDPDTPGDGHWENNLAATATHTSDRWTLAAPDADLNYGWGETIQLNADIPLSVVQDAHGRWNAGLGAVQLAVKWRFLDRQDLGYTLSTYPRFSSSWVASSTRRAVADAGQVYFLPVEAATKLDDFGLDAELGRDFGVGAPSQWQLGAIVAHRCGATLQCMFELRESLGNHDQQTLLNLGAHWQLSDSLALIGAAGRRFGQASSDRQLALLYLGVQIVR